MDLSQREKLLIILLVAVMLPALLYRFGYMNVKQYSEDLTIKNSRLKHKIEQIETLGQELKYLQQRNRIRPVPLRRRVDSILRNMNLTEKAQIGQENLQGTSQRMTMKIDQLNYTELTKLLFRLEHSKPVIILDNISISPSFQNKKLLLLKLTLTSR